MSNELAAETRWSANQTREQFRAIAWLRWRMLINGFRRKGSTGDVVAMAVTAPIFALIGLAVSGGAGLGAWYFASHGQLNRVGWLLWATFGICQFLNINVGQPGTTFDPTQLIRFPLRARDYIAIKLFFGILSPANVMVTALSLAIAIGVSCAVPWISLYVFFGLAIFAATNAIFTRMIFAWVDRWLSTRRAREVFTAVIFVGSLGFQYINVHYNLASSRGSHHHHVTLRQLQLIEQVKRRSAPVLAVLPPGLVGDSIEQAAQGHGLKYAGLTLGSGLYAALFFAVFAVRTRTEFRGEVFSDRANALAKEAPPVARSAPATDVPDQVGETVGTLGVTPVISALFSKEILSIRRNSGAFYALVAPVVMVLFLAGRMASRNNSVYVFPGALAYALVGVVPLTFNSFGLEGAGCQFYFLAPVRLRDVFLAKNLINFLLALADMVAVFFVISYVSGVPTLRMFLSTIMWATATLLVTTTFGNRRSITAPKKIDLGRTSSKQASPLSALMSLGMLIVSAAAGAALLWTALENEKLWLLPVVTACMAVIAAVIYLRGLMAIDRFALAHRDELFEELCMKK